MRGKDHVRFGMFVALIVTFFLEFTSRWTFLEREWFWAFILIYAGSTFPDWDLVLGIKYHRLPLTHGCFLSIYTYFFTADGFSAACFSIGIATHLFLDLFPSDLSIRKGWQNLIRGTAPGNLRWIPSRIEYGWFVVNALICLWVGIAKLVI